MMPAWRESLMNPSIDRLPAASLYLDPCLGEPQWRESLGHSTRKP
jgi:hypothetical protein